MGRRRSTGRGTSEKDTETPLSLSTVRDGGRVYAMVHSARFEVVKACKGAGLASIQVRIAS